MPPMGLFGDPVRTSSLKTAERAKLLKDMLNVFVEIPLVMQVTIWASTGVIKKGIC